MNDFLTIFFLTVVCSVLLFGVGMAVIFGIILIQNFSVDRVSFKKVFLKQGIGK